MARDGLIYLPRSESLAFVASLNQPRLDVARDFSRVRTVLVESVKLRTFDEQPGNLQLNRGCHLQF
jgi:hypothetical protein